MTSTVKAPASDRSRYLFFLLAALAVLMAAIDSTIVSVALPQLTTALNAPLTWVGWTLTAYQLVQVVMLPMAGRLSDTLGRKRVFLACVMLFTIGSLLCGLAPSIWLLILFRAVQALGGGGLMPSAVGIISDQFRERRAQAVGLFSSVFPLGGIIGPNLGGLILQHWSWRELFFINVPIGIVVLLGIQWLLRQWQAPRARPRLDVLGAALFAAGILALLWGMTELGNDPTLIRSPLLWVLFATGLVMFGLFLWRVRTAAEPVVDYDLLVRNPFLAANLYNFFFGMAVFGFFAFVPYYAVVKYGLSTFESGAVLTPRAVTMILVSTLGSIYVIPLGYHLPMLVGMALIASSLVLLGLGLSSLTVFGQTIGGFWLLAGIVALSGAGMGLAAPASNNAALDLAPRRAAGVTGIRGMFRLTGGIIGIASIVLALSYFPDQGQGLSLIFLVLAAVLLLTVPLTLMIPDTARRRRRDVSMAPEQSPVPVEQRRSGI